MPEPLILCYHSISTDWPASLAVTPEQFRAQLELVLERGYRPTTFEQAVTAQEGSRQFAVTFDDAYTSVLERARPIMDELGVPGTVFVPTDFAGSSTPMAWEGIDRWLGGPHEPELLCLGWEQLRELADAGWEVGSHTCSHPHLTQLDDQALRTELERSKALIEDGVGRPCRSIAYPYGDTDARVVEAARAAGYQAGASLPEGAASRVPLDWARVGVYHDDSLTRFRMKLSPVVRTLRGSFVWDVVAAMRERRRRA